MPCRRVRHVVFLWVDREREASLGETSLRDPVARHLEQCPQCRERAAAIERMILRLRECCPREHAPSRLGERIRSLIERE